MNRGTYGNEFDRLVERSENSQSKSTLSRMQQQYWETKRKLFLLSKKKEDDCIVNSDFQLDTKLELFKSIEETCSNLILILEGYQDRLCCLSHEENCLGRFLKECGKMDKTRAGKMMSASGKTLSYTAQQRIQLRTPLVRLYQEVETFQYRAITDTFITIEKMEKTRNAYRAALMWMKDISAVLDPSVYKQLDKFRKVQAHVRRTKVRFDKLKIDTQQKIDLLSISRCNMLSHALVNYQNSLLLFWEKTSKTMNSISECFKGYQYYEFSVLKELTETSKKLSEDAEGAPFQIEGEEDKDKLLFFDSEYRDDDSRTSKKKKTCEKTDTIQTSQRNSSIDEDSMLLDLSKDIPSASNSVRKQEVNDILSASVGQTEISLLNDILGNPPNIDDFSLISTNEKKENPSDLFLPSHLMSTTSDPFASLETNSSAEKTSTPSEGSNALKNSKKTKESKWFELFAELDPLSNPDAIGKSDTDDRNC